jgi:hypothetical protein
MSGSALRDTIRALIESHPDISISAAGHVKHAERFVTRNGNPIGFEPGRIRFQNIWVRADSVDFGSLSDIAHKVFRHSNFHVSKPNHDLFGEPAFKDADLIRFQVKDILDATRVIAQAIGHRSKK